MISKGIRGAITVRENTEDSIKEATIKLIETIVEKNNIEPHIISHAIFSLTSDLNAAFPAKFARLDLGWSEVPMMCFNEIDVPNALPKCLRVLVVVNCSENFEPEFVYLEGAESLRK